MSSNNLVKRGKAFCEANKHRFTSPREKVLSFIASCNTPVGAYEILSGLSSAEEKINPPTVYRAIDFWSKYGFIHRVQSMNAYIACCCRHEHLSYSLFICDNCQEVTEITLDGLASYLSHEITALGRNIRTSNTEIYGQCGTCG